MLRTIFLDLDDVCNKYTMHVLRCVVGNHVRLTTPAFPPSAATTSWRLPISWAARTTTPTCSGPRSQGRSGRRCRAQTSSTGWCRRLCSVSGTSTFFIASSSVIDPDALAGKLEWIHRNMPSWIWRRYVFTEHKYLLAAPDALLIDDHQGNCEEFEAAGGQSILVPRPWNRLAEKDAREHVFNRMSFRAF